MWMRYLNMSHPVYLNWAGMATSMTSKDSGQQTLTRNFLFGSRHPCCLSLLPVCLIKSLMASQNQVKRYALRKEFRKANNGRYCSQIWKHDSRTKRKHLGPCKIKLYKIKWCQKLSNDAGSQVCLVWTSRVISDCICQVKQVMTGTSVSQNT